VAISLMLVSRGLGSLSLDISFWFGAT